MKDRYEEQCELCAARNRSKSKCYYYNQQLKRLNEEILKKWAGMEIKN